MKIQLYPKSAALTRATSAIRIPRLLGRRRPAGQHDFGLNPVDAAEGSSEAAAIFQPLSTVRPTAILPRPLGSHPVLLVAWLAAYQSIKAACGGIPKMSRF